MAAAQRRVPQGAFACEVGLIKVRVKGHHINDDDIRPTPGRSTSVLRPSGQKPTGAYLAYTARWLCGPKTARCHPVCRLLPICSCFALRA